MNAKEQNINLWDFQDIFMSIICLMAIMLMYLGFTQFLSLDVHLLRYLTLSQIVLYLGSTSLVFYFAIFKKSNSIKQFFGLNNLEPMFKDGLKVFVLIILATTFIDHFFEIFAHVKSADVYTNVDKNLLRSMSFLGVFFAPFAEEVFFRGFLQPVFVRKFGVNFGVVLVALTFSLLHVLYLDNISALLSIITVGLILSFAKEKTVSLIPCIIAHFLNNSMAVISMTF